MKTREDSQFRGGRRRTKLVIVWLFGLIPLSPYAAEEKIEHIPSEAEHWAIEFPFCKKDSPAWRRYSPLEEWMDSQVDDWRKKPDSVAYYKERERGHRTAWRKEDAVDETWLDINGDGWCDVITSGDKESHKKPVGKPILLKSPRGIFVRTENGFKSLKPGAIPSEYEGSSITAYWDLNEKHAVLVKRIYQGNLVGAGDEQENVFHYRQMLRAAFGALAGGDRDVFYEYYEEAEPFTYNGVLSDELARQVWDVEARRAGVEDQFTWTK